MLHTQDAFELFAVDVPKDVAIVDFTSARFFAARVVADLEIRNLRPGTVDVGDEISLGDLLMVKSTMATSFGTSAAVKKMQNVKLNRWSMAGLL